MNRINLLALATLMFAFACTNKPKDDSSTDTAKIADKQEQVKTVKVLDA